MRVKQVSFDFVFIDADKQNYEQYYERGAGIIAPRWSDRGGQYAVVG